MTALTPHYAYIQSRRFNWSPRYLTTEFDPYIIRGLLLTHPNMKLKQDKDDAAKRFIAYRFLAEAGFYEAALAELDGILKDLPDQKEKAEKYRAELRRQVTGQLLDLVELAQKVGRHQWAQAIWFSLLAGVSAGVLVGRRSSRAETRTRSAGLA